MRIGILPFGARAERETALADALRTAEIDVILADAPVTSYETASEEASRLARADCDGILFHIAPYADVTLVGVAALHLAGTPLLVSGTHPPLWLDAAGVLADLGVPSDRMRTGSPKTTDLTHWLRENSRAERQRGSAAARKLYGQTCAISGANFASVDVAQWMHQFGVVIRGESSDKADFGAPDGDLLGALTRQLLKLLRAKDEEPVYDLHIGNMQNDLPQAETKVTIARISRQRGRYYCLLFTATRLENRFRPDGNPGAVWENLLSSMVHAIAGEHIGALRAACEALDIEPIILR